MHEQTREKKAERSNLRRTWELEACRGGEGELMSRWGGYGKLQWGRGGWRHGGGGAGELEDKVGVAKGSFRRLRAGSRVGKRRRNLRHGGGEE